MLAMVLAYAVWFPAVLGLGTIAFPLVNTKPRFDPSAFSLVAIFGIAVLGTIANLANFFWPVGPTISLGILLVGYGLAILRHSHIRNAIASTWPCSPITFGLVTVVMLVLSAIVVAGSTVVYDTGLYHMQTVKWLTESRLPLGLANLHGRLAFNSLWFSSAAALELPLLTAQSTFIVNGLLFGSYGVAIIAAFVDLTRDQKLSSFFLASSAVFWVQLLRSSHTSVGSGSPDLPVALFTMLMVFTIIKASESREQQVYYAYVSLCLAILGIMVKLSAFPLVIGPLAIWFLTLRQQTHLTTRDGAIDLVRRLLPSTTCWAAMVAIWAGRGIGLSGYVAYPAPWGRIGLLRWAAPPALAREEQLWIESWARQPGGYYDTVLANWNWVGPWAEKLLSNEELWAVVVLAATGLALSALLRKGNSCGFNGTSLAIAVSMSSAGILFWFVAAPEWRFGFGYFWALAILLLSIGLTAGARRFLPSRLNKPILALGMAITLVSVTMVSVNWERVQSVGPSSWPFIDSPNIKTNKTNEEISVLSPGFLNQCWNTDLPCTPYFNPKLSMVLDGRGRPVEFRLRNEDYIGH
jgi:hypothetical protein